MNAGWMRSLRKETTLQKHYRRALHTEHEVVANVSLDRWNAASGLQEQVDSARGVENAQRLARCRAINARFNQRAVMTDLKGAELQNILIKTKHHDHSRAFPGEGCYLSSPLDDATVTRSQALERFGIDLGSVGAMTKARIDSLGSNTPGTDSATGSPLGTTDIGRLETNANSGDLRKQEVHCRRKRRSGGGIAYISSNKPATAAKRREMMLSRLRLLDGLISGGSLGTTEECGNARSPHEGLAPEGSTPASISSDSDAGSGSTTVEKVRGEASEVRASSKSLRSKVSPLPAVDDPSIESRATSNEFVGEVDAAVTDIQSPHAIRKEGIQTGAVVNIPKGIGEGQETKLRAENVERDISDKGLPNHRPFWSWLHLLPPGSTGIPTPDTITVTPSARGDDYGSRVVVPPARSGPAKRNRQYDLRYAIGGSCNEFHLPLSLVWVSSRLDSACSNGSSMGGGTRDDATRGRAISGASAKGVQEVSSQSIQGIGRDFGDLVVERPISAAQEQLHSEIIQQEEELLRAARAVCECGRWGGGGEGPQSGRVGPQSGRVGAVAPKLPLALLKVWERSRDDRARLHLPGNEHGKGGGRRRKLTVVRRRGDLNRRRGLPSDAIPCGANALRPLLSGEKTIPLWTENDVVEALRDMTKGRWGQPHLNHLNDVDSCCVQAFVKSVGLTVARPKSSVLVEEQRPPDKLSGVLSGLEASASLVMEEQGDLTVGTDCAIERQPSNARIIETALGTTGAEGQGVDCRDSSGCSGQRERRKPLAHPEHGDGCQPQRVSERSGSVRPIFYRAAWKRNGRRTFVWKITSRYPYLSDLAAHLCPLAWGSSSPPFVAERAEEGATAMATVEIENLAEVLARAYNPNLQRLWADWAVRESDGQWFLVEVHGIKTNDDIRNAAEMKATMPDYTNVKSKVFASAQVIAHSRRNLSLDKYNVLMERIGSASAKKRLPNRPPIPANVCEKSKSALLARRSACGRGPGASNGNRRQIITPYWRCAGAFCQTQPGESRKRSSSTTTSFGGLGAPASAKALLSSTNDANSGGKISSLRGEGGLELEGQSRQGERDSNGQGNMRAREEENLGRIKHALVVETPRTVLFRLVINARAILLGWRASAAHFAQMEKPVQLCSACYAVCEHLERERVESTRRAMEAEEAAVQAEKTRRNRRPPGWKSRMQHELEESLGADRNIVSRLLDEFVVSTTNAAGQRRQSNRPPSTPGNRSKQHTLRGASSRISKTRTATASRRGEDGGRRRVTGTGPDARKKEGTSKKPMVVCLLPPPVPQGDEEDEKEKDGVSSQRSRLLATNDPIRSGARQRQQQPWQQGQQVDDWEQERWRTRRTKREVRARRKAKEKARRKEHPCCSSRNVVGAKSSGDERREDGVQGNEGRDGGGDGDGTHVDELGGCEERAAGIISPGERLPPGILQRPTASSGLQFLSTPRSGGCHVDAGEGRRGHHQLLQQQQHQQQKKEDKNRMRIMREAGKKTASDGNLDDIQGTASFRPVLPSNGSPPGMGLDPTAAYSPSAPELRKTSMEGRRQKEEEAAVVNEDDTNSEYGDDSFEEDDKSAS